MARRRSLVLAVNPAPPRSWRGERLGQVANIVIPFAGSLGIISAIRMITRR